MQLIQPSFKEIETEDPCVRIAICAHNCYQVDKTDDCAAFLARLASYKHYAMFEHCRFVLKADEALYGFYKAKGNHFIDAFALAGGSYLVSFSLRPLLEDPEGNKELVKDLPLSLSGLFAPGSVQGQGVFLNKEEILSLEEPVRSQVLFITLKIITDRGVTHELVRHRLASYAQESTRYCNYAKDKFGNQLTFIEPLDYAAHQSLYDLSFKQAEDNYFALLQAGSTPEMARAVLPNKLKAAIIITASAEEFERIFALRTAERAHPDMRQVMIPIQDYFRKKGYIHD